jgi:hypothetical protein
MMSEPGETDRMAFSRPELSTGGHVERRKELDGCIQDAAQRMY